jgi:hypothetical protein
VRETLVLLGCWSQVSWECQRPIAPFHFDA